MLRDLDCSETSESSRRNAALDSMAPTTLDQMLRYRARLTPDLPLLWYPLTDTDYIPYTAAQLNRYVEKAARHYSEQILAEGRPNKATDAIGLMGVADLDYVVTIFALYRLGRTVVLLSPRLAKDGYIHLIDVLDVHDIIYHSSQSKMAAILNEAKETLHIHQIAQDFVYKKADDAMSDDVLGDSHSTMSIEDENLAVVVHSSGSTGLPKPVRLLHSMLVTAASKNMNMTAFSCVPFFHGFGLICLHRAIYSGQQFFIYNASIPLTAKHLINTILKHDFEIFLCVAYVLKLLAETDAGMNALKKCKIVLFAGSPCPDDLGDSLTERGIRLISDYGITECGPLMNTMRPSDDHAWNYLRPLPHSRPYMKFEEQGEGILELICLDGMPWKSAKNRDDGSYATGDLFQKHPTLDAYKYVSRKDDTLVLSNGEKADPSVPEGKIRQHYLVAEAVIFGAGKPELGMLLIKSDAAKDMDDGEVLKQLWPLIEDAQKAMPMHGKIARPMVGVLPTGTEFPRTDKGTVIRQKFYRQFAQEIEHLYSEESGSDLVQLNETEARDFIQNEIFNVLALEDDRVLGLDTDLLSLGIDSLKSIQLRRTLQLHLDLRGKKLPMNVVYENPTVRQLSDFVSSLMSDDDFTHKPDDGSKVFTLIEELGNFHTLKADKKSHVVVLTGATGSLGAHILAQLLKNELVEKVHCLVRASSSEAALTRVDESLRLRRIHQDLSNTEKAKLCAHAADLAMSDLGLDDHVYHKISLDVTTVIHAAWPVNFNMRLSSFRPDLVGTRNLLNLCLHPQRTPPATFSFCSSISTSMNVSSNERISESVPSNATQALDMGYAQSKFVAEHLCIRAAEQAGVTSYVIRIGQIMGDTEHGIWNANEAVPMMIQTAKTIGALPDIEEMHRWLPVDVVARTILEISLPATAPAGSVMNVINPSAFKWNSDLLPKLRAADLDFQDVPLQEWMQKLRKSDYDEDFNHPIKLLPYFESIYGEGSRQTRGEDRHWVTENAAKFSPTFAQGWSLTEEMVYKFVKYFLEECWSSSTSSTNTSTSTSNRETDRGKQTSSSADNQTPEEQDSFDKGEKGNTTEVVHDVGTSEPPQQSKNNDNNNDDNDNNISVEDAVLVPRAGEIVWDPATNRFEVDTYNNNHHHHQQQTPMNGSNEQRRGTSSQPDMKKLKEPKEIVWEGTGFTVSEKKKAS